MERELFSEFYFGNINGEGIRAGKKLQANDSQFGDFIFTTAKQDANKAGTTQREENNMVVNFSQLTRPVSSTEVPFYDANIENDMRDSSTSMDSMDFQGKEKAFFETEQSSRNIRKGRDASELNCQNKRDEDEENGSDARKPNQRATSSSRRSRSAEMHNLSERRRRDKINEKLKALQELLPHCTKTDKASMLDEAIEYLKSLQIQLQMMWVESGMAPMLFSENQHYMPFIAMDHQHHHHANSLPYPRVTRPLFDDQSKLRGHDANQQHINSASQTQNLHLHKFLTQGPNQRSFGGRMVQEPQFGDGLVIDRSSFL